MGPQGPPHTYQLMGLLGNLACSLEQTCFAVHLFPLFLSLEEYVIQSNAGLLQPYQYSFFGLCRYAVLLALRRILALLVLRSLFFFFGNGCVVRNSCTFVLRCTSQCSFTLSIYQPIPGSIITTLELTKTRVTRWALGW